MAEEDKKSGQEGEKPGGNDQKVEEEKAATHQKQPPPPEEKKGGDESKQSDKESPPPPQEIVLRVYMHCEGCARKVRRCLKGFAGVEDVITDCKSGKVVVMGEKADPLKVLERVQKKSHRQVELLSPIPKPQTEEDKKTEPAEKQQPAKPDDKKEEPQPHVIIVVLQVYMHCEACAQGIKKRILRMKGVESAEPDLKSSQVTVKGVFEAANLVEYLFKRTGKHAAILKQEPEKKEEEKSKEEKKPEQGGGNKNNKEAGAAEEGKGKEQEGAGSSGGGDATTAAEGGSGTEDTTAVEVKRNEYYYFPERFAMEMYSYPYPSQIFSEENPNACSFM